MPEILQTFGIDITASPFPFSFVPMIVPLVRGIYTTLTIRLSGGIGKTDAEALYKEFFKDAPFTRVRAAIPEVKDVAYTNYCDIGIGHADSDGTLIVITAIDNLVKGAAGQAIQNMNLMLGLDERLSLSSVATRQVQVTHQL
jgi:N-acetyl-gamma-glutamyl-phosphate reductase